MPAVRRMRWSTVAVVAAVLLSALPGAAYADMPGQRETARQGGNFQGNTLTSRVTVTTSGNAKSSSGTLSAENSDWTPPPCWYEPFFSAKNFKTYMQSLWSMAHSVGGSSASLAAVQNRYQNGQPYKDFNVAEDGKGMWWIGVQNPQMTHDPRSLQCNQPWFWVPDNTTPNVPLAVTPQVLAEYAYGQVHLPATTVRMNPAGKQTVNLPTWVWTDKGTFKPVSVTAKLPGTGLWATTTAKPVSLHIDPGTQDATVYPESGDCPINADGSIGTPYNGQANATPPCGLTYLHSTTATGPFPFKATLTWQVSWSGSGNTGGTLPDGTFGTATPVTVQEIQTVVR